MSQRTIDCNPADQQYITLLIDQINTLSGLVLEIKGNPVYLLQPNMRTMLFKQADQVRRLLGPVRHKLCIDNPGQPIQVWDE